ncbi:peptidoglycan recognition family protein [Streptomyces sp. NPDC048489]|uniref:peptidoglycan recognition protein family protein n=1 Tax=Streptomyces sp. NPDC048489 TaxID=3154504 RepID=UPI003443CD23
MDAGDFKDTNERVTPKKVPQKKRSSSKPSERVSAAPFPPVGLITRAEWGADESKRFTISGDESSPPQFFSAQAITVHHTDTSNEDINPAATVRAIYEYHAVSNDWGDIGYHFLIDSQGNIYEGRYSGTDSVPAHDTQGRIVTGFHTIGFNPGNIGIALVGDFSRESPSPKMQRSLTELTASLAKKHSIDPLSSVDYRNPVTHRVKRTYAIAGHRDWISTDCPGLNAYLDLSQVREKAARLAA